MAKYTYTKSVFYGKGMGLSDSLLKALEEEPDRFADLAIKGNPTFISFEGFILGFKRTFSKGKGESILNQMTSEAYAIIFRSDSAQNKLYQNLGQNQAMFDAENENVDLVLKSAEKGQYEKQVEITSTVYTQPSYKISTGTVTMPSGKTYTRTATTRKYSPGELKFIAMRKQEGRTPKETAKEFNAHFSPERARTYSAIKTKYYRFQESPQL